MAVMAELHAAIYIEPRPDDDCCREDDYQEQERTTLFWEERQARSIEMDQQQRFLKERCARVADEVRIKKEEKEALSRQLRLKKRLARLLQDFPRDEVLQELRRIGIF